MVPLDRSCFEQAANFVSDVQTRWAEFYVPVYPETVSPLSCIIGEQNEL